MNGCPICGSSLFPFVHNEKFTILKCSNCGLGMTKNLKSQRGEYHRDEIYIEEEPLFQNIFLKRVNIMTRFKKAGKALEVGCSTGIMLSLLQEKGWDSLGVEISPKAAEVAKKRGIDVVVADFMQANVDGKFDLVILNHTLEHMENPPEVVKKIKSLLSPGGLLYIDLPNFGGLSAKLMKDKWGLLLPDEHLWHFTYKSLQILLKQLGFKIIFIEKASGIWDYGRPSYGIFLSLINFKKRFFREVITAIPSWIVTKLGIGSDLMVIAGKI